MMENHSFDDHLGMLGQGDGLTRGPNGKPVNYNPDPAGGYVRSFHNPNTCGEDDSGITQSWDASHTCWDNGTNMGFVKGCSGAAMGYWTHDDLPFYYDMASRFPIGDRYFCSVMAQTYPNRRFLIAGTALGDISTNGSGISSVNAPNGTIFDRLNHYGISWKDYYPDFPTVALFEPVWSGDPTKAVHISEFFTDAASGNLPAFSLVDPYTNYSEEDGDIWVGEAYAALFINAVINGPAWEKTLLIWTYDEHGGWYDHVPPRKAVKPDNVPPSSEPATLPGPTTTPGSGSRARGVRLVEEELRVAPDLRPHVHPQAGRDQVEPPRSHLPRRQCPQHAGLPRSEGKTPPFAEPPQLKSPQNPFASPAALPATSYKTEDVAQFHPICTELPSGSLPPHTAQLSSLPSGTNALLAAQRQRFQKATIAQTGSGS